MSFLAIAYDGATEIKTDDRHKGAYMHKSKLLAKQVKRFSLFVSRI